MAENLIKTPPINYCPKCHGWAVVSTKGGQMTCPDCQGYGAIIQIGTHQIGLNIPAIIRYGPVQRIRWWTMLRNLILVLASALSFVVGFDLLSQAQASGVGLVNFFSPDSTLGSQSATPPLFWFLVIVDCWSIYLFATRETPVHYLSELDDGLHPKARNKPVDGQLFFTEEVKKLLVSAIDIAERRHLSVLTPETLFEAVLDHPKTRLIFARMEIPRSLAVEALSDIFNSVGRNDISTGSLILAPETRQIILKTIIEAESLGFDYVDVEDFLLVYLKEDSNPISQALSKIKDNFEVTYDKARAIAYWINEEQENIRAWLFWYRKGRRRPKGTGNRAWTSVPTPFLDCFSRDLTKLAGLGYLPIVRVRDREIQAIINVLSRTTKNNVLLVGEPGVGKTSVVGAVAERMLTEEVPEPLKDKRLVELDLGALASGLGTAEENAEKVIAEVERAGNIILYIGHIEALLGSTSGAFNPATLLADALSRSRFQIIASATPADRYRYLEQNPALASLFQIINIPEVSESDAIRILEEEAPRIERHQRVFLTYPAIKSAVHLSQRLVPEKVLPDKAIEVIDQAASLAAEEKSRWVTEDYVVRIMKERTNVPVEKVTAEESQKLLNLEQALKERVIGQDMAIHSIVEALKRARVGLKDEKRPIGSFLFVGPTGVGKTETAKALADIYFGSEEAMIRLDMSEYQDPESVYRLIGPPPRSGQFAEGGSLTIPVRERPFSLILLDEFEKANSDVRTLFLQLLDDGRLTENTGRTISFANTIIIATSNAGTKEVSEMIAKKYNSQTIQNNLMNILQNFFQPELLNRFDGVAIFNPMTKEMLIKIATNMVRSVAKIMEEKHSIKIKVLPEVISYLAEKGFDPVFGARPLRRVIQDKLEGSLANILLQNKVKKSETITVSLDMLE